MNQLRCRIHRLGFKDLERAVDDPVLADLMRAGWSVMAPVAVEDRGEQQIVLILAPPARGRWWRVAGMILLGAAVSIAAWLVGGAV